MGRLLDWLRGTELQGPGRSTVPARSLREAPSAPARTPSLVDAVRSPPRTESFRMESTIVTVNGRTIDASAVPGLKEALAGILAGDPGDTAAVGERVRELLERSGAVALADESGASAPAAADPVERRLERLEQLRTSGLISEEEYAEKRKQILDAL